MVVAKKMWGIAKKKWLVANFPVHFMASSHKKMATFYFVVGFEINWVLRFDCQFGTKDIRDRAYPDVPGTAVDLHSEEEQNTKRYSYADFAGILGSCLLSCWICRILQGNLSLRR